MEFNPEAIDEATLALMYLVTFKSRPAYRAWKSFDWDSLNRLHEAGYIGDPVGKAKSVWLTDEGLVESKRLAEELFGSDS